MRLLVAASALALAGVSVAPARGAEAAETSLERDPVLARLVEESLALRPELRQVEAAVRAERERVPVAGALPDPVLSLAIQNDGFDRIQIGRMETSFYQVMLTQGLPWPGKRGLRADVARLSADAAGSDLRRARLSTEADVRRTYLDLLLARDRLSLLGRLEAIWQKASGTARARYESGEGAQSDVLRAQLELSRLRQRRWNIEAQEKGAVQALNRLRARPVEEPIATSASVADAAVPPVPELAAATADALSRSPELARARVATSRGEAQLALARRERYPDLSVSAGIMPRGALEPMWQAGVSVGLPLWFGRKQASAVAAGAAAAEAEARGAEAVEQLVRLRVAERQTALAALAGSARLYRDGLLVQSRATLDSTLAQYRVGKVTFASVLEASAGYLADEDGFLTALADALRIAIAGAEVSLEPMAAAGAGWGGGGAMPGAGATGSRPATSAAGSAAGAESGTPAGM